MLDQWWYQTLGQEFGPVPFAELKASVSTGLIGPDDLIRDNRKGRWLRATAVDGLFRSPISSVGNSASLETAPHLQDANPSTNSACDQQAAHDLSGSDGWFVRIAIEVFGPLTTEQIVECIEKGVIEPSTELMYGEHQEWMRAGNIEGLFRPTELSKSASEQVRSDKMTQPLAVVKRAQSSVNASDAARQSLQGMHSRRPKRTNTDSGRSQIHRMTSSTIDHSIGRLRNGFESFSAMISGWLNVLGLLVVRMLRSKIAAGAIGVCLLMILVSKLPANRMTREDAYAACRNIFERATELRSRNADKAEWDRFLEVAGPDLTMVATNLEHRTEGADPITLNLLWVSRDYLPRLLQNAERGDNVAEEKVSKHLAVVRDALQSDEHGLIAWITGNKLFASIFIVDAVFLIGAAYWFYSSVLRQTKTRRSSSTG